MQCVHILTELPFCIPLLVVGHDVVPENLLERDPFSFLIPNCKTICLCPSFLFPFLSFQRRRRKKPKGKGGGGGGGGGKKGMFHAVQWSLNIVMLVGQQRGQTNVAKAILICRDATAPVLQAQPPMVLCRMEAQLKYVHVACTFLHVWRRFACSVGVYEQNFSIGAQSEVY